MLRMSNASISDLEALVVLFEGCIRDLNQRGIYQWNDVYPNRDTFEESIREGVQYLFHDGDELIGAVILNEVQAEEWADLPWQYNEGTNMIIHALAIDPSTQGRGYGQRVLEACEAYALENGFKAVRLDVFSENPVALGLYKKNGYQKVGEVIFPYKPEGHQCYYCYEKPL